MNATNNAAKKVVLNALRIYADGLGCSIQEVGKLFRESEETRECIFGLVALHLKDGPYVKRLEQQALAS